MAISFSLNGESKTLEVDPSTPLLWVLRDHLRLTGTKFGCGIAQCGACTVHLNGQATRSCVLPVSAVEGQQVATIEGARGEIAETLQRKWEELAVYQCGYCQSGQLMSAIALLETNPNPSDDDIDQFMSGNICRCATYVRIKAAIKEASQTLAREA